MRVYSLGPGVSLKFHHRRPTDCNCTLGRIVLHQQHRTLALSDRTELALFSRKASLKEMNFSNAVGTGEYL